MISGIRKSILLLFSLLMLSSCDDINAVLSLLPKFDSSLPNNISGTFAYFSSEENMDRGEYDRVYRFDSRSGSFTLSVTGENQRSGKYKVEYRTYAITECNGTIVLAFDDGSSESLEFYYYATAVGGPEYIRLSDRKTYYYWGN